MVAAGPTSASAHLGEIGTPWRLTVTTTTVATPPSPCRQPALRRSPFVGARRAPSRRGTGCFQPCQRTATSLTAASLTKGARPAQPSISASTLQRGWQGIHEDTDLTAIGGPASSSRLRRGCWAPPPLQDEHHGAPGSQWQDLALMSGGNRTRGVWSIAPHASVRAAGSCGRTRSRRRVDIATLIRIYETVLDCYFHTHLDERDLTVGEVGAATPSEPGSSQNSTGSLMISTRSRHFQTRRATLSGARRARSMPGLSVRSEIGHELPPRPRWNRPHARQAISRCNFLCFYINKENSLDHRDAWSGSSSASRRARRGSTPVVGRVIDAAPSHRRHLRRPFSPRARRELLASPRRRLLALRGSAGRAAATRLRPRARRRPDREAEKLPREVRPRPPLLSRRLGRAAAGRALVLRTGRAGRWLPRRQSCALADDGRRA